MRCNRKTACFAVTPRKEVVGSLNITKVGQLRRRKNLKVEITDIKSKNEKPLKRQNTAGSLFKISMGIKIKRNHQLFIAK